MQTGFIPQELKQVGFINELAEQLSRAICIKLECPAFAEGGVPVAVAAKVYGKSQEWIRKGIADGWLPIGYINVSSGGKRTVYISPKKLWEDTGYVWKGKR